MMTACDLSAITKPWEVQSKVRSRVLVTRIQSIDQPAAVIVLRVSCGSRWL